MRIISFDVGVKNLSYCECTVEEIPNGESPSPKKRKRKRNKNGHLDISMHNWKILDITKNSNTKKMTIEDNIFHLINTLKEEFSFRLNRPLPDKVVIEQQPAGNSFVRNSRMKIISHSLQTFFLMEGVSCVTFVSPKNKNKLYTFSDPTKKYKYSENKKKSVDTCVHYLEYYINKKDNSWTEVLNQTKKKDDLADSFLQLLVYCTKCFNIDNSILVSRCEEKINTREEASLGETPIPV